MGGFILDDRGQGGNFSHDDPWKCVITTNYMIVTMSKRG